MKEDYLQALAPIQTKVSEKHTSSLSQFEEWEQKFFLDNDFTSPTGEHIEKDDIASSLLTKLKYANTLADEWKNRSLK